MESTLLRKLGNLCYGLNGGLAKLHNHSLLDKLAFYFWGKSYSLADRKNGS